MIFNMILYPDTIPTISRKIYDSLTISKRAKFLSDHDFFVSLGRTCGGYSVQPKSRASVR